MNLTDNDRQRIKQKVKQFAKNKFEIYTQSMVDALFEIAEYATIYEREQQVKEKFMQVHSASFRYGHKLVPSKVSYRLLTEQMAQRNHGQSLDRLNERGGMSVQEILDNIHSRNLQHGPQTQQHVDELNRLIKQLEAERSELVGKLQKRFDNVADLIGLVQQTNDTITMVRLQSEFSFLDDLLNSLKTK